MKRRCRDIAFISAWLAVFLAVGCADDLRYRSVFDSGAGEAHISFSVDDLSSTRADSGRSLETDIDHAYLLFYSSEANPATDAPVAAARGEIDATNPMALSFKMPLSLLPDTDYRLVALANADAYVPDGYADFSAYVDSWCRKGASDREMPLCLYRAERIISDDVDYLPMRGGIGDDAMFRFSMSNGNYNVNATLLFRRMVARIDVANMVKEGFKVEGVALCNWRDAVAVSAPEGELGNRMGAVRGVLTDEGEDAADGIFVAVPDADDNGIQRLTEAIYSFPSATYASSQTDRESTALIIKAKYGGDTESSFYRVNVGTSGSMAEVKENTKYLVTIQSVKGRGAATPEEAYSSEESQIVLSVVQDWDLEGAYAMDDKGSFIVLSTGRLEFDGNSVENREVRVLTSPGLSWSVEYHAGDEASEEAFHASKLNENSFAIGPTGKNSSEDALYGTFIVTAVTPEGGTLTVDVAVSQTPGELTPEQPVIPDDMPFALVPESYERVKISHIDRTIEIDGFDPSCFNSFIDLPFTVYIKDTGTSSVNVSTTLQWPLEGRVSLDHSSQYFYCEQSFAAFKSGMVQHINGQSVDYTALVESPISVSKSQEDSSQILYISVGAMGPDDPAIIRDIVLSLNGESVSYKLTVKPCPCIIDDVILIDAENKNWLIQDRNVQDIDKYNNFIGLNSKGEKYQAYNYSQVVMGLSPVIPNKFTPDNSSFNETKHLLYQGKFMSFRTGNTTTAETSRVSWLEKYCGSGDFSKISPFYGGVDGFGGYESWIFPTQSVLELCASKIKVSKMRMFLVSEVPANDNGYTIPVCCYWPYRVERIGDTSTDTYAYHTSSNGIKPDLVMILNCLPSDISVFKVPTNRNYQAALIRLVRPLTEDEFEMYKTDYLGYGDGPHKLTLCHPDTYESESFGWLPD